MRQLGEKRDTNKTYGQTVTALAAEDSRIVTVEADLMKASGSAPFREAFPQRMFNVGIAEQDALSFAAGLAAMGKIPFAAGFACFMAQRACDQAQNSIAYNNFNVKIIGTYAGLTSEKNGGTHISIDDLAIYRNMPRFEVYDPGDANEFEAILRYAAKHEGPVYIRSNKGTYETFTPEGREFVPGKAEVLSEGTDVGLITTGITTLQGIYATEELQKLGISVRHVHMPSIKPIDRKAIAAPNPRRRQGGPGSYQRHGYPLGHGGFAGHRALPSRRHCAAQGQPRLHSDCRLSSDGAGKAARPRTQFHLHDSAV